MRRPAPVGAARQASRPHRASCSPSRARRGGVTLQIGLMELEARADEAEAKSETGREGIAVREGAI